MNERRRKKPSVTLGHAMPLSGSRAYSSEKTKSRESKTKGERKRKGRRRRPCLQELQGSRLILEVPSRSGVGLRRREAMTRLASRVLMMTQLQTILPNNLNRQLRNQIWVVMLRVRRPRVRQQHVRLLNQQIKLQQHRSLQ